MQRPYSVVYLNEKRSNLTARNLSHFLNSIAVEAKIRTFLNPEILMPFTIPYSL